MVKATVLANFKRDIRPGVIKRHGLKDKAAMRQVWGIYTDSLYRDGSITMKQYETWTNPF